MKRSHAQKAKAARRQDQRPIAPAQADSPPRRSEGIEGRAARLVAGIEWRAAILALTIAAIISLAANRPPPSRLVQTDYCVVTRRGAWRETPIEPWQYGWVNGYGPCSQQDIYRQI